MLAAKSAFKRDENTDGDRGQAEVSVAAKLMTRIIPKTTIGSDWLCQVNGQRLIDNFAGLQMLNFMMVLKIKR